MNVPPAEIGNYIIPNSENRFIMRFKASNPVEASMAVRGKYTTRLTWSTEEDGFLRKYMDSKEPAELVIYLLPWRKLEDTKERIQYLKNAGSGEEA